MLGAAHNCRHMRSQCAACIAKHTSSTARHRLCVVGEAAAGMALLRSSRPRTTRQHAGGSRTQASRGAQPLSGATRHHSRCVKHPFDQAASRSATAPCTRGSSTSSGSSNASDKVHSMRNTSAAEAVIVSSVAFFSQSSVLLFLLLQTPAQPVRHTSG